MEAAARAIDGIESKFEKEIERVTRGDELPPGVSKLVKVYIARKRKVSAALQAYAAMTTSAARGAVRDISQLKK